MLQIFVAIVLLGAGAVAARRYLRRPKAIAPLAIVPLVLRDYTRLSHDKIEELEKALFSALRSEPARIPFYRELIGEKNLLHALRLAKNAPTARDLRNLGASWAAANCGSDASGLRVAAYSPNWQSAHDFITTIYLRRAEEICAGMVNDARLVAARQRDAGAQVMVYRKAAGKLNLAQREFIFKLPGLRGVIDSTRRELQESGHAILRRQLQRRTHWPRTAPAARNVARPRAAASR